MKKIHAIVAAALYAVALHAQALSLGASRGTVVLGVPLDLAIEIQPDAGVTLAESCISVQLFDGERPIHSADVRAEPLPSIPGFRPALRIQTQAALRDPVVQARVQAGCHTVVTRTYNFLVEIPPGARPLRQGHQDPQEYQEQLARSERPPRSQRPELEPEQSSAAKSAPPPPPPPRLVPTLPPPAASPPKKVSPPRVPPAVVATPVPAPAKAPPLARPTAPPAPSPAPAPARLVMEPVRELPPVTPTAAKAQTSQPEASKIDAAQREQEEQKRRDQELQHLQLQAQLNELKTQIAQERANAAQLRQLLEHTEPTRDNAFWLYLLGGALALMMAVVVWMGRRMRQLQVHAERVWRDSVRQVMARDQAMGEAVLRKDPRDRWGADHAETQLGDLDDLGGDSRLPDSRLQPYSSIATAAAPASVSVSARDSVNPSISSTQQLNAQAGSVASALPNALPNASPSALPSGFPPNVLAPSAPQAADPTPNTVQIIHPEALFDILQQAEFFESVGENDQAIEVLQKHIAEHGMTSPLSYLELLRLYHQLGRSEDFQLLRTQFMRHFNAEVPAFSAFRHLGRGLEYYVDTLAEIEMQWTSPRMAALLETYIFLRPENTVNTPPFDLAAFNDLLLLLTIAQTTPPSARGAAGPRQRTTPKEPPPLPAAAAPSLPSAAATAPPALHSPAQGGENSPPAEAAFESMLDLNLDWNFEKVSDMPPLPVTPAPTQAQHVGFGMNDEKFEIRFELESSLTPSVPPALRTHP